LGGARCRPDVNSRDIEWLQRAVIRSDNNWKKAVATCAVKSGEKPIARCYLSEPFAPCVCEARSLFLNRSFPLTLSFCSQGSRVVSAGGPVVVRLKGPSGGALSPLEPICSHGARHSIPTRNATAPKVVIFIQTYIRKRAHDHPCQPTPGRRPGLTLTSPVFGRYRHVQRAKR
jgi:hypothetical protein